jgi:hypothetical protein
MLVSYFSSYGNNYLYNMNSYGLNTHIMAYLLLAYNKHHMLLEPYMTLDCKKRCGDIHSMDVQYKEARHLCRYHGKPLFMGTVTAMNEYKYIRTQFHVVSDIHAQFERSLSATLETIQAWGQKCHGTATPIIQQGTGTFYKAKFLHQIESRSDWTNLCYHIKTRHRRTNTTLQNMHQ